MSPAAIGGAHLRATSVNGFGPISTANGEGNKVTIGIKGGDHTYSHLDDLLRTEPAIEPSASIRKLIETGEAAAKQAETYLDFHRPDFALREYKNALIITADYIPKNAQFLEIQTDHGELHRSWYRLQKRVHSQQSRFVAVQEMIKENNARSGVKPLSSTLNANAAYNSESSGSSNIGNRHANGFHNGMSAESSPMANSEVAELRIKPPIQPKPQGLHGKALQGSNGTSAALPENELTTRFARLRSASKPIVAQDPRIRTQQIEILEKSNQALPKQGVSIVRPQGPREMPMVLGKTERPILDMVTNLPSMPRPPDAIYSPARSTDTISANNPPLLARGSSYFAGRRDSTIPTTKSGHTPAIADDRVNFFSPPDVDDNYTLNYHTQPEYDEMSNGASKRASNELSIPNSTTISAEQLYEYLKKGSHSLRMLLVDIRNREQFDDGHVMAQSIICLEPISLRDDMSAEELGERIVLSPESEQRLYDQKHDFDLVVYYDQSSTSVDMALASPSDSNYLKNFTKIIYDHAYDHRLKRRPMLLVGGLDAWTDLVGYGALQSSKPTVHSLDRGSKHAKPLGRMAITREAQVKRRNTRSRTLSAFEEAQWDEALSNRVDEDNIESADGTVLDEAFYAKTTADFLRRYPELPSDKQSMALPSIPRSMLPQDSVIPAPPTRPPPALPRQRSNGISEKAAVTSYAMTGAPPDPGAQNYGLCGLRNINGAICYMNSVIQALSASPDIRNFLIRFKFDPSSSPPAQKDESGPPKQLMTRNLCSLLQHMWCGKYNEIVPRMFLRYVHATHARATHADASLPPDLCFGTQTQHDAVEFMGWLLNVLLDEHNIHRDKTGVEITNRTDEENKMSRLQLCRRAFDQSREFQSSMLLGLVAVQMLTEFRCMFCGAITRRTDSIENTIQLGIPSDDDEEVELTDLLRNLTAPSQQTVDCDACNRTTARNQNPKKRVVPMFSYLPPYLMIGIKRAQFHRKVNGGHSYRNDTPLSFPQELDMAPYTWLSQTENDEFSDNVLKEQKPPFIYDCYAVIQHRGTNESGHYWTMARRFDADAGGGWTRHWHEFNDSTVIPGKRFADTQGKGATALFYQRRPWR